MIDTNNKERIALIPQETAYGPVSLEIWQKTGKGAGGVEIRVVSTLGDIVLAEEMVTVPGEIYTRVAAKGVDKAKKLEKLVEGFLAMVEGKGMEGRGK
jgi:hypothetical protein